MRMAGKSIMFSAMYIMIIINILISNILHFNVVHLFFIVMTYKLHIFAIGKQNTTRPIMKKSLLIIIAAFLLIGVVAYLYKPTYKVILNGEMIGYTENKGKLQNK